MSASKYTYESMWSEADRAFIARVKEFPSLEAHGDSRGSSLRALKNVISSVLEGLKENGEEVPAQIGVKKNGER
jgi:predicted RNase H-like HicB family nuclease